MNKLIDNFLHIMTYWSIFVFICVEYVNYITNKVKITNLDPLHYTE